MMHKTTNPESLLLFKRKEVGLCVGSSSGGCRFSPRCCSSDTLMLFLRPVSFLSIAFCSLPTFPQVQEYKEGSEWAVRVNMGQLLHFIIINSLHLLLIKLINSADHNVLLKASGSHPSISIHIGLEISWLTLFGLVEWPSLFLIVSWYNRIGNVVSVLLQACWALSSDGALAAVCNRGSC